MAYKSRVRPKHGENVVLKIRE